MSPEVVNNAESMPTLQERMKDVYTEFCTGLEDAQSMDELKFLYQNCAEKIGTLQNEAVERDEDFSVTFANGLDLFELQSLINEYKMVRNSFLGIGEFSSEKSKDEKTQRYEDVRTKIPDDLLTNLDRLIV